MFSLDPDQKGAVERTMLTQVAIRLVVLDPSFLGYACLIGSSATLLAYSSHHIQRVPEALRSDIRC